MLDLVIVAVVVGVVFTVTWLVTLSGTSTEMLDLCKLISSSSDYSYTHVLVVYVVLTLPLVDVSWVWHTGLPNCKAATGCNANKDERNANVAFIVTCSECC